MLELAGPGAFELVLPIGIDGKLAALCDQDRDDYIRPEADKLSEPVTLGVVETDLDGVVLTLVTPPAMGAGGGPESGGGPPGGPAGDGGPPRGPGGPGAGPPDRGAGEPVAPPAGGSERARE